MRLWPIIIIAVLAGCHSKRHAGLEFNAKRAEIGLPLLDSSWTVIDNIGDVIKWAPRHGGDSMVYDSKLVRLKNNKVKREENHFTGRVRYHTIDGNFMEELFISCDFNEFENPFYLSYQYFGQRDEFGKFLTKIQADSLLRLWRLKSN